MSILGLNAIPKVLHAFAEAYSEDVQKNKSVVSRFVNAFSKLHPKLRLAILLSTPWISMLLALSSSRMVISGLYMVRDYIYSCITSSVLVPGTHPLSKPIMAYMVSKGMGQMSRNLALQTPNTRRQKSRSDMLHYEMSLGRVKKPTKHENKEKENWLELVPDIGVFSFTFQGRWLTFEKKAAPEERMYGHGGVTLAPAQEGAESIVLSCTSLTGNTAIITDFLHFIKSTTEQDTTNMTKIFRPKRDSGLVQWDEGVARPSRTLDAVTLDAHIKDPLVQDVTNYLTEETKRFYVAHNIPWRRGYLFYGPPGTGKTSMACAIAGQYGLNVYLMSMTHQDLYDETLVDLFDLLPSRCILLMEDIDSAGIVREEMTTSGKKPVTKMKVRNEGVDPYGMYPPGYSPYPGQKKRGQEDEKFERPRVTLSTLLNCLDGISAPEGRIVIMTSNKPDSLDEALVRPGRIDRKSLFGYASREVAHKMFMRILGASVDGTKEEEGVRMAEAFAECIPVGKITPAEVQGHLLQNMGSAKAALDNAEEFVKTTLEVKEKGKVVAGFEAKKSGKGRDADGDVRDFFGAIGQDMAGGAGAMRHDSMLDTMAALSKHGVD